MLIALHKINKMMESVNDEFFDGVIDTYEELGYEVKDNDSRPEIYFGQYQDYILITLDDNTRLIKFLNKHGQVLTINKNKCEIKKIKDIDYYFCLEAPYILYSNNDSWVAKELVPLFDSCFY